MQISPRGRFVFVAQWIAPFVLPAWFFLGRGLVGAGLGWLAILGIVVYGIFVIAALLVPPLLTMFDVEVRRARRVRHRYAVWSVVLWSAVLIAALFAPDSSDSGHLDSAVTTWTRGALPYEASAVVFYALAFVIGISYVVVFVLAAAGITRRGPNERK